MVQGACVNMHKLVGSSGGSRILERGVPVTIKACVARMLGGVWGHAPQENFMIVDLLRLFLVYSWGETAKNWTTYY